MSAGKVFATTQLVRPQKSRRAGLNPVSAGKVFATATQAAKLDELFKGLNPVSAGKVFATRRHDDVREQRVGVSIP